MDRKEPLYLCYSGSFYGFYRTKLVSNKSSPTKLIAK